MIDLHAHILPGLDDGAKNLDESLAMCLVAVNDGTKTMVATPHTGNGNYDNTRDRILTVVGDFNRILQERGIGLTVLPGADVHAQGHLDALIASRQVMTVNDNMRYVMVEFPRHVIPPKYIEWMFRLALAGVTPVLTHPERNTAVYHNIDIVRHWVEKGGLVQLTAMSLTGAFGEKIRGCAEELLKYNLVHVIASDAHSVRGRPPILSEAVKIASSLIGAEHARKLVEEYPAAIVDGKSFDAPEPLRKKSSFFLRFLGQRPRV